MFLPPWSLQGIPYADAMNKTLVFAIFDFDRFSKHDQIGEVKVPLCQIDLAQTIEEWRELQSVEGEGGQVSNRKQMPRVYEGNLLSMIMININISHSLFFFVCYVLTVKITINVSILVHLNNYVTTNMKAVSEEGPQAKGFSTTTILIPIRKMLISWTAFLIIQ